MKFLDSELLTLSLAKWYAKPNTQFLSQNFLNLWKLKTEI